MKLDELLRKLAEEIVKLFSKQATKFPADCEDREEVVEGLRKKRESDNSFLWFELENWIFGKVEV